MRQKKLFWGLFGAIILSFILLNAISRLFHYDLAQEKHQKILLKTVCNIAGRHLQEPESKLLRKQDPVGLMTQKSAVFVSFFGDGKLLSNQRVNGGTWHENLVGAIRNGMQEIREKKADEPDDIMVQLSFGYTPFPVKDLARWSGNIHRGTFGLLYEANGKTYRVDPQMIVENNWNLKIANKEAASELGLDLTEWKEDKIKLSRFETYAFWIPRADPSRGMRLIRGMIPVDVADVTADSVRETGASAIRFLSNHVSPEGLLPSKIRPASGREAFSGDLESILTSVWALCVHASETGEADAEKTALLAVNSVIKNYFREEGELGYLLDKGEANVRDAALFALALSSLPNRREVYPTEVKLGNFLNERLLDSGLMRTFRFAKIHDHQEEYTGLPLYYLARIASYHKDKTLKARLAKATEYYKDYYSRNPHPDFLPWHVKAAFSAWKLSERTEDRDYALFLADELAAFQQWEDVPYAESRGRFYPQENNRRYPSALTTARNIYALEQALQVASLVGDTDRVHSLSRVILRGMRYLSQIQFKNSAETYYTQDPSKILGALRTTAYNSISSLDAAAMTYLASNMFMSSIPGDADLAEEL